MSLPSVSKAFALKNSPTEFPDLSLGNSTSTFELLEVPIPGLKDGEALVQTIYLSNDPSQRVHIDKNADPKRSYAPLVKEGDLMTSYGLARVVKSKAAHIKEGELRYCFTGWSEYAIIKGGITIEPIPGLSPSVFAGTFGGTGLTAYIGLTEILKLQKGESIVVSAAAGAVGNIVVQYAKKVIGASKVIAITSSASKCQWLTELGADCALNYNDSTFSTDLDRATEGFVDTYFDNVGGPILNHMLRRIRRFGRVTVCGAISGYNNSNVHNLTHWNEVISNRLTLQGFIVSDYLHRMEESNKALVQAFKEGKINLDGGETLERVPFEEVPRVWGRLFDGTHTGKLITEIVNN